MNDDKRSGHRELQKEGRLATAVQNFARRRPKAYLLGCAAAGFAVATLVLSAGSTAWSVSRTLRGVSPRAGN
jgi:hypothetical protein